MKIDLHIHTKNGSDGNMTVDDVFKEAKRRDIMFMSITDHDSIDAQERATELANKYGITYITGIELNVTMPYHGKLYSLDFLGYQFDPKNRRLINKLKQLKEHREKRAIKILDKLNNELEKENLKKLTDKDIRNIEETVDGVFGRPHIAEYLVKKGVVRSKKEAFFKYLIKCDVAKLPLSLDMASQIIRKAGGKFVLAHPNDPNGTSLTAITHDLRKQSAIISKYMLDYIDGIECWHSRHDAKTTIHYIKFAQKHNLIMTGGSDCHQKPLLLGTSDTPEYVATQFAH